MRNVKPAEIQEQISEFYSGNVQDELHSRQSLVTNNNVLWKTKTMRMAGFHACYFLVNVLKFQELFCVKLSVVNCLNYQIVLYTLGSKNAL